MGSPLGVIASLRSLRTLALEGMHTRLYREPLGELACLTQVRRAVHAAAAARAACACTLDDLQACPPPRHTHTRRAPPSRRPPPARPRSWSACRSAPRSATRQSSMASTPSLTHGSRSHACRSSSSGGGQGSVGAPRPAAGGARTGRGRGSVRARSVRPLPTCFCTPRCHRFALRRGNAMLQELPPWLAATCPSLHLLDVSYCSRLDLNTITQLTQLRTLAMQARSAACDARAAVCCAAWGRRRRRPMPLPPPPPSPSCVPCRPWISLSQASSRSRWSRRQGRARRRASSSCQT